MHMHMDDLVRIYTKTDLEHRSRQQSGLGIDVILCAGVESAQGLRNVESNWPVL